MNTKGQRGHARILAKAHVRDQRFISRRSFLGTTVAVMGAASAGWPSGSSCVQGAEAAGSPTASKNIRVGMMTAPLSGGALDEALDMAKRCGMVALEVMAGPDSKLLNPMTCSNAEAESIKSKLAERGLEISSLANYMNSAAPGETERVQEVAKKMIDAAAFLGVPTICMITGIPRKGMNRIDNAQTSRSRCLSPHPGPCQRKGGPGGRGELV
jgi:hypothetical protein